MDLRRLIRSCLPGSERYEFGFADLRGLLNGAFDAFPFAVAVCRKLDDAVIDGTSSGPTPEYLALYNSVNEELDRAASAIADEFTKSGIKTLALTRSKIRGLSTDEGRRSMNYSFSLKMAGTRAGLGWIGKTDLFVSSRFGPRVRLAAVLLDSVPGECAEPVRESRCGDCTICVAACPASAANGRSWSAGMGREEFYDAFACRETAKRLCRERLGREETICGICVSVCPRGERGRR